MDKINRPGTGLKFGLVSFSSLGLRSHWATDLKVNSETLRLDWKTGSNGMKGNSIQHGWQGFVIFFRSLSHSIFGLSLVRFSRCFCIIEALEEFQKSQRIKTLRTMHVCTCVCMIDIGNNNFWLHFSLTLTLSFSSHPIPISVFAAAAAAAVASNKTRNSVITY